MNDPKYKLNNNLRGTIRRALIEGKAGRAWKSLLDYTLDDLINHLKSTIPPGYSWEEDFINGKGVLQMDHIVPISAFNFTKSEDEDFQRCWALENLRIVTREDNEKKWATVETHFQPTLAFG